MGTFNNVPEDKLEYLSDEERKAVEDRQNGVVPEDNYNDSITRDENKSVDSPASSPKKSTGTRKN